MTNRTEQSTRKKNNEKRFKYTLEILDFQLNAA